MLVAAALKKESPGRWTGTGTNRRTGQYQDDGNLATRYFSSTTASLPILGGLHLFECDGSH